MRDAANTETEGTSHLASSLLIANEAEASSIYIIQSMVTTVPLTLFLSYYFKGADPSEPQGRIILTQGKKQPLSSQQTSTNGCNAKKDTSLSSTVRTKQGNLPLRRRMDDEEEDMSRPITQPWGTPFRDIKYEDRATQIAAGQALTAITAAMPTSQGHNNNSINMLPCSIHRQQRIPFHGNAGLRSHFPAQFEPMEDRGEQQIEEEEDEDRGEEDDRVEERPEEQAGVSVEMEIGRKLREIGDKLHQDHIELFVRHQRQNLPVWMRLTMAFFAFLFPREALIPRLRGEQR